MHGIVLDWGGTLSTLQDPREFLRQLRAAKPDALIVLHTGAELREIEAQAPGVMALFDTCIEKPLFIRSALQLLGRPDFTSVTFVDDDTFFRNAMGRVYGAIPCTLLTPADLPRLLEVAPPGEGDVP